jgi:hypothetical protein
MDMPHYPPLPPGTYRPVYFCGGDEATKALLGDRGYTCIEINTLERHDDASNGAYLLAKLQGLEEGTIKFDYEPETDIALLKAELRAYGLDTKRSMSLNMRVSGDDINKLFGWSQSRHTLAENSTVVAAQTLNVKRKADG